MSAHLVARRLDEAVEVDGDLVVPGPTGIHRLNPTAALVWRCCDGDATVDSLVADLSAAFGAPEAQVRAGVAVVVDELVASGLVEPVTAPDAEAAADPAALVLDPEEDCAGCGPGPAYERWVWLRLGEHVVSVGGDADVAAALADWLHPLVVRGPEAPDPDVPAPVHGVVLPAGPRARGTQELPRLHRGAKVVLRSRDPERIVRALLAQLAAHLAPPDLPALRCLAVGPAPGPAPTSTQLFGSGRAEAGRVVLVPEPTPRAAFERAAAAAGLAVSPASVVFIDASADPPAVVVGAPELEGDADPLIAVARERLHLGAEPAPLPDGRYEVAGIAVPGAASPAGVLAELAPPRRGGIDPEPALATLLALVERVPVHAGADPGAVATCLDA